MKGKTTKRIAMILAGTLLAAPALAGCGRLGANTIKFFSFSETQQQMTAYSAMVDAFNKTVGKEKGIKVAHSPKLLDQYESNIIRTGMSTSGPDLYMVPEKKFKAWTRYELFAPLDDLVAQSDLDLSAIWSTTVERYRYDPEANTSNADDPLYSLPVDSSPTALYYNKTAMEAAGVIVIGVPEEKLGAWNRNEIEDKYGKKKSDYPTLADITVPDKGYVRTGIPYVSPLHTPTKWYSPYASDGSLQEVLIFNDEIAMNWDEVEDIGQLLTKSYNPKSTTTHGYYTEWWFNYGWSVGGDCLGDLTGNGDWTYTLPDYTPNYKVLADSYTGAYTGKTYAKNETLSLLDKLKVEKGETLAAASDGGFTVNGTQIGSEQDPQGAIRASVLEAEEAGTLGELPSAKTALTRFANLAGASNTLNIAPKPLDLKSPVTSISQFTVGEIAMVIETAANLPYVQQMAQFEWSVAPLPVYKEYKDPEDGLNGEVLIEGIESGHASSTSISIRVNSTKKEKAFEFLKFLVGEGGQSVKLKNGLVPNIRALTETEDYKNNSFAYMDVFLRAMDNQKAGDWWYMPDTAWISIWADRLNGDVRNGTMDLRSWFTAYLSQTNEQLKKYKEQ